MRIRTLAVAVTLLAGAAQAQDKTDPWLAVDRTMRTALGEHGVPMGLAVYDRAGTRVFQRMYGDFAPDRRVAIASASKMVTGVVLFRLVDEGRLSLDSTTGAVLGWRGEKGALTLQPPAVVHVRNAARARLHGAAAADARGLRGDDRARGARGSTPARCSTTARRTSRSPDAWPRS